MAGPQLGPTLDSKPSWHSRLTVVICRLQLALLGIYPGAGQLPCHAGHYPVMTLVTLAPVVPSHHGHQYQVTMLLQNLSIHKICIHPSIHRSSFMKHFWRNYFCLPLRFMSRKARVSSGEVPLVLSRVLGSQSQHQLLFKRKHVSLKSRQSSRVNGRMRLFCRQQNTMPDLNLCR